MPSRPSPHGEGGLKYVLNVRLSGTQMSLPTRGGWIEIDDNGRVCWEDHRSLPTRGGWIEMMTVAKGYEII